MGAEAVFALDAVSVRLGRGWVLAGVDLAVAAGEGLWLTGDNGAGKTTLLSVMAGTRPATRGQVRLFGEPGPPWPPGLRRRLGVMGHAHGLYEGFTGAENLTWMAELAGHARPRAADAATKALAEVGLAAAAGVPLGRYSAGMVRRLALARLLVGRPEVMLVDEPFVQLDAAGAAHVQEVLSAHRAAGGTLVFTSHDAGLARPLASRRLHLAGGRSAPRAVAAEGDG